VLDADHIGTTPQQKIKYLKRVRNFLVNDLRTQCHHCENEFDWDYNWVRNQLNHSLSLILTPRIALGARL
jgi:hypothetical protein